MFSSFSEEAPGIGDSIGNALKTNQIKMLKLSKQKKLTLNLEDKVQQPEFLIEYFSGIENGYTY